MPGKLGAVSVALTASAASSHAPSVASMLVQDPPSNEYCAEVICGPPVVASDTLAVSVTLLSIAAGFGVATTSDTITANPVRTLSIASTSPAKPFCQTVIQT